jgi:ribosomal protein L35
MRKVKKHLRKGRIVKAHSRKVSWTFGGKRYSGTELLSKETSTHRFARTENGKIKRIKK